ncbi:hypothetical protein SFRURICE_012598 [Spodoptera frugiperda]|uniref:SFRICE_011308 n=1 Tax=Spodoptera frugiperda TaxID=7108 RepID=A0A2H1WTB9_SPOFR|nr:hypothetical protein SFRURICE_012598 [Spodoptera frugiperda]
MPDENICTDVKSILDRLENNGLQNYIVRSQEYQKLLNALGKDAVLSVSETDKLLAICARDLKEELRYAATLMNIISIIVTRVQRGNYSQCPNLVPSALAVIHIITTIALHSKVDTLKQLCYDTLLSFPDETIAALADHHEQVMEIFNLYCHVRIPSKIKFQACAILHKILKLLEPEKKAQFVEKGISVWFSKIFPTLMNSLALDMTELDMTVEILENLTEELVAFDYTENLQWHYILECICNPQKYPTIMKNLLIHKSGIWHRVWMVYIKLLKHQITQAMGSIGTPINSMLPVVEAAFKLDVDNRCKAFECWTVLIDSFSTETNESNINKRIKLLIIPLRSNNAKAEETALAKFKCWWHLLEKFQNKIDKFIDTILVTFLHFCFGKHNATDKTIIVPGQISLPLKKLCIQAIVDLVGHVNCDGCTELPKLKGKMINTKNLVDNWNHWIFSLTSTIMMSANSDEGLTKQQMTCLWKSFLLTIGELPENTIRKDLFSEMLSILVHLVQECKNNSKLTDIVFNALLVSLFDGDARIKQLMKSKNDVTHPLCKITSALLNPALHLAYQSCTFKEMVTKLLPLTNMLLDPAYCSPTFAIGYILKNLTATDISLTFWTALSESICETQYDICALSLCNIMMWPLERVQSFKNVDVAALTWYTMHDIFHKKLKKTDVFPSALSEFLNNSADMTHSYIFFKLCVLLGVIKHKLSQEGCASVEKEMELLHVLTGRINSYQTYEKLFPILIDRVLGVSTTIGSDVNEIVARYTLFTMRKILKILIQATKQTPEAIDILSYVERSLHDLTLLFQSELYHKLIPVIVDELIDISTYLLSQSLLKNTVITMLKTLSLKIVETDATFKKINAILEDLHKEKSPSKNQVPGDIIFTAPKSLDITITKKVKKKEPSIVNTVVENGEEYVVVKSNWKFNPRKLTENQKEKLQRKREDIPALYQDLSQSQDEFKLVSWKTDSQDTSNSSKSESKSSKLGNDETATVILSKLPSSNVVPTILENFFAENKKKDSSPVTKDALPTKEAAKVDPTTPQSTKSPRMALKDRVFRNVRNLIEKSGVQKENKDASDDLNKTDRAIIKTPTQSKSNDTANVINSAPPLLSADRPSRVKRKPRKFEELMSLNAKKKRQSLQNIKSTELGKQSTSESTSSNDATDKDESVSNEDSLMVPKADLEKANKSDAVQVLENQNILDKGEVMENNKEDVTIVTETQITESISEENCVSADAPTDMDIDSNKKTSNSKELDNYTDDGTRVNDKPVHVNKKEKKSKENETSPMKKDEKSGNKKARDVVSPSIKEIETVNEDKETKKNDNSNVNQRQSSPIKKKRNSNEKEDKKEEEMSEKEDQNLSEKQESPVKSGKRPSTPTVTKNKIDEPKSSTKKPRKSRIEKELAIDMVEGHPFLKMQSQSRVTRRASEAVTTGRRKTLLDKLNKSKSDPNTPTKGEKKTREKNKDGKDKSESDSSNSSVTVEDTQERDTGSKDTSFTDELPYSDDVIESSQDSTITTISVKSTKKTGVKVPVVALEKIKLIPDQSDNVPESQSILDNVVVRNAGPSKDKQDSRDDIELSVNKTAVEDQTQADLTENMDTEPIDTEYSDVVIVIAEEVPPPLTISSDESHVGQETQEIAEADTQPTNPIDFMEVDVVNKTKNASVTVADSDICSSGIKDDSLTKEQSIQEKTNSPLDNTTLTLPESVVIELETEGGASSPSSFGDEAKRKQDFLNNTLEISPIKNMSPDRNKKSPSPETSTDYVVITLSSPVHSNGEPFEKCTSPEVFTEDKISPDKRDQSPPRVEVTVTSTSPSSSLSLKKNRPQVRSGGRAAQMLGLCCVPDKAIINQEKTDSEEIKKPSTSSTPARRNLRMLYNSVSENIEPPSENEDSDQFLKFRRSLPAVDSSPSGPILKRKLVEISDEATVSPASKRKRVSFHDPPVSTTVSVQKYIEPGGVRSPSNSMHKRLERQLRQHTPIKSPKRLENAFKLETVLNTVLNKAIESFADTPVSVNTPDDTQVSSLDETPVVEIVRASELNDTDPIYPDLVDCKDPIDNIAGELSSPVMKSLLVRELLGKVETVGDLAKMTELEVNRLRIKAPKIKVAKKVLSDYASKRVEKAQCEVAVVTVEEVPMSEPEEKTVGSADMEVQTVANVSVDMEMQTVETPISVTYVQTETTATTHAVVQTDQSGSTSTADIVKSCLEERPDFVKQVSKQLEDTSKQEITEKLSVSAITDVLVKKISPKDAKSLLNRVLESQWNKTSNEKRTSKELSFIREFMCERFDSKDLILFCSEVLKSVYDKPALPKF